MTVTGVSASCRKLQIISSCQCKVDVHLRPVEVGPQHTDQSSLHGSAFGTSYSCGYLTKLNPYFASYRVGRCRNKTAAIYICPLLALNKMDFQVHVFTNLCFVQCLAGVRAHCRNGGSQLAFPSAHGEFCLFAGSRLAVPPMTCYVHILQQSLQAMRVLF